MLCGLSYGAMSNIQDIEDTTFDSFLFGAFVGAAVPAGLALLTYTFGSAADGIRAIQEIPDKNFSGTWSFYTTMASSVIMGINESSATESHNPPSERAFGWGVITTSTIAAGSALALRLL